MRAANKVIDNAYSTYMISRTLPHYSRVPGPLVMCNVSFVHLGFCNL